MGTLWGIGVGPGAPDLLTIRAARCLKEAGTVFVPESGSGENVAERAVRPHLGPGAALRRLHLPMTRDPARLKRAWEEAARSIVEALEEGDSAFATIGDVSLYSTFAHLARHVLLLDPKVRIRCIPGVPSFAAAAAEAGLPLVTGESPVTVLPLPTGEGPIARVLDAGGAVAFLKPGGDLAVLKRLLEERGRLDSALRVTRCGLEGQKIDALRDCGPGEYLAVILVPEEVGK